MRCRKRGTTRRPSDEGPLIYSRGLPTCERDAVEASPRRPAPARGPVFIVGAMGTGTTLLRLMLDSHENIAIPHATGFMRIYSGMRHAPFKWSGRYWANRLGWSDEEMDELARGYFDTIFARYAAQHG